MDVRQRKFLAEMLRGYARAQADINALIAILKVEKQTGKVTEDWEWSLEEIRKSESYRASLAEFEPLIAELDQANADSDLSSLLDKLPPTKLPS